MATAHKSIPDPGFIATLNHMGVALVGQSNFGSQVTTFGDNPPDFTGRVFLNAKARKRLTVRVTSSNPDVVTLGPRRAASIKVTIPKGHISADFQGHPAPLSRGDLQEVTLTAHLDDGVVSDVTATVIDEGEPG
jgi:hypothetical protein